jgi:hypothetical protein
MNINSILGGAALSDSINTLSPDDLLLLEAKLIGMRQLPPTIDEFIEDDYFIGSTTDNGKAIYPRWRQFLRELYPDPIHTTHNVVSLGGAIGIGKSRIARIILAYDFCKLTYFDTLEYASLDNHVSGKSIDLLFEHRTGAKAWEELIDPFYDMMKKSPYFSKGMLNDYKTRMLQDGETTNIGIGKDLLSFVCSECNFQRKEKIEAKVFELTSRLTSRFQKLLNYLPHIVLDSSANDEGNFMDDYLAKTTWRVKTARFSTWEMRDFMNMFFLEGEFKVYAGDSTYEPFVIDHESQITPTMDKDKIIICPKELENEARSDTRRFLKEKVGLTTSTTGVFISNKEKLRESFTIPCPVEEIVTDFYNEGDTLWARLAKVIEEIPPEKRLYIGVDLGIVNDRTGLAIAYFDDWTRMGDETYEPIIKVPLAIGVSRMPGQETPIYKIIDFILRLNKVRDVALVATDQFQATQLRQDCTRAKIKCVLSSVDRTTEPYNYLKRQIYLGLLHLPANKILQFELSTLIDTGKKIDHVDDGVHSKDISDAVANAVFNLYQNLKTAQMISGRFNTVVQMDLLDAMGWSAGDIKDDVVARITRQMANS